MNFLFTKGYPLITGLPENAAAGFIVRVFPDNDRDKERRLL